MTILLYVYFVLNLIGGIVGLILPSTPIWSKAISKLKYLDNDEIAVYTRRNSTSYILVSLIMLILMIIFL